MSGITLAFAIVVKATLAVLVPVLVLGALAFWRARFPMPDALWRTGVFAVAPLAASLALLATNLLLFGDPTDFGYRDESHRKTRQFPESVSRQKPENAGESSTGRNKRRDAAIPYLALLLLILLGLQRNLWAN